MRKPAGCEIFTLYLDLGGNFVDVYYVKFIEPHIFKVGHLTVCNSSIYNKRNSVHDYKTIRRADSPLDAGNIGC